MPSLDVSEAFLEPMFLDGFVVLRQAETISNKGRSVITPEEIDGLFGTVCAASPNDLERLRDYEFQGNAISIVTNFMLRGVSAANNQGFQPDVIVWAGDQYTVVTVQDYARYGVGFIQAIAVERTYVGLPPATLVAPGQEEITTEDGTIIVTEDGQILVTES